MSDDARPLWASPEVPDLAPAPEPRAPEPADDGRPPLRLWWVGFAAFLAALVVTTVVSSIIVLAAGQDEPTPPVTIAATYVQDLAFFGAAFLFARLATDAAPLVALGLVRPARPGRALGIVVLCWIGFLVVGAVYQLALGGIDDPSGQTIDDLGLRESAVNVVVGGLLVAVLAPIVEEVLFRGLLFGALWKRFGFWIAAIASGVCFGGIHAGGAVAEALPVLMLLGFLFALVYKLTGSLIPAIFFHAVNNGIALVGIVEWAPEAKVLCFAITVSLSTGLAWLISKPARSVLPGRSVPRR